LQGFNIVGLDLVFMMLRNDQLEVRLGNVGRVGMLVKHWYQDGRRWFPS